MFRRTLQVHLKRLSRQFPVVSVVGPRQSGKTTLAQLTFPDATYISLEDLDEQSFAREDPRGFLARFKDTVILDEVQRVPELFSYLQGVVDRDRVPGKWILTGSQNFLLMERISQSLAGRTALTQLFPLSLKELLGTEARPERPWNHYTYTGLFPEIHNKDMEPADWYRAYIQTYVERDMRDLVRIGDLSAFSRFVRLCAARSGQLLNYNALAIDVGISQPTVKKWVSILETCGLVILLRPHYVNFSKRLVKTPKLYWTDPGLLCHLLRVKSPDDLLNYPFTGQIFETFVVSEFLKAFVHNCLEPDIFFWRDRAGHEVDLIVEAGKRWIPVEIKSSTTISRAFFKGLNYWLALDKGNHSRGGALIHTGDTEYVRSGHQVIPWYKIEDHFP